MSLLRADLTAHQFGPHTHDAFVIAVTEAGGAEISSRGITEKVGPSTLFVSNPEEGQHRRDNDELAMTQRPFQGGTINAFANADQQVVLLRQFFAQ